VIEIHLKLLFTDKEIVMKHISAVLCKHFFKTLTVLAFLIMMPMGVQAQGTTVVPPEQESKWKKAGEEIKEAAGAVGEASKDSFEKAREGSASAWDKTKKGSAELWHKTKEGSGEAWDKTKDGSAKAWDKTKEGSEEVWDKTKDGSKKAWDKTREVTGDGYDTAKQKVHEMTAPDAIDAPKEPLTPPVPAE
jgi:hypothetical protein